ncbi:hypothetical protein T484DRAFT_3141975 [Baffinella frigidus]|nr:hypothetical protein T484DRAFT_3141975 [Cryptophyta sp. CCMP2293]
MRQGSGELSPPLQASASVESPLLSASHTRAHSCLGPRKFRTSRAPPARDRVCSVPCALASAPVLSFAGSGVCLLRESRLRGIASRVSHDCFVLFGAFARGLPLRGSSAFLGRGLPHRGLLHPIRSNRPSDGDCLACFP